MNGKTALVTGAGSGIRRATRPTGCPRRCRGRGGAQQGQRGPGRRWDHLRGRPRPARRGDRTGSGSSRRTRRRTSPAPRSGPTGHSRCSSA